jgi:hypothetical protein
MQGQATESDCHMVEGKSVDNKKTESSHDRFQAAISYPGINDNP